MRRPAICAHRGASRAHPENSLAAFATAIEMGADMIETDVRRTPRGKLVLHHDPLGPRRPRGLVELAELVALADGRVALDVELKEAGDDQFGLMGADGKWQYTRKDGSPL